MKTIIAGTRTLTDYDLVESTIQKLEDEHLTFYVTEVVSGCAKGADTLGEEYARTHGLDVIKMPADWDLHGKSAGYIRNQQMADYAEALIAFWDGESKGTKHMIDIAMKKGMFIKVVKY